MKKEDTSWVSEKEESPSYHRNIKENLKHRLNLLSKKKQEESEWDIFYQEEPMFPPSDQDQNLDDTQGFEGFENTNEHQSDKSFSDQLFETVSRFIKVFESSDPENEASQDSDNVNEMFGSDFKEPFDEGDDEETLRKKIKKTSKKGSKSFSPNKKNTDEAVDDTSDFASSAEEQTGDIKLPSGKGNAFKKLYDLFMMVFKLIGKGGSLIYKYLIYIPEKVNEYLDKFSNMLFDAFSSDSDEKFRRNDVKIIKYLIWCIVAFLFTIYLVGKNLFAYCVSTASNYNGILYKVSEFTGFTKYTLGLLMMPSRHIDRAFWLFAKAICTLPNLLQYLTVMVVAYFIVSKFSIYDELKALMKGSNTAFRTTMLVWIFGVCTLNFIFWVLSGCGSLGPSFSFGIIVVLLVIIASVLYVMLCSSVMVTIAGAFLLTVLLFGKYLLNVKDEDIKNYISLVDKTKDEQIPTTTFEKIIQFLKEYISSPGTVHAFLFFLLCSDMMINAFNHIKSKDLKLTFLSFIVIAGFLYSLFLTFGGQIPENFASHMVMPFFQSFDYIKKTFFTPVNPVQ